MEMEKPLLCLFLVVHQHYNKVSTIIKQVCLLHDIALHHSWCFTKSHHIYWQPFWHLFANCIQATTGFYMFCWIKRTHRGQTASIKITNMFRNNYMEICRTQLVSAVYLASAVYEDMIRVCAHTHTHTLSCVMWEILSNQPVSDPWHCPAPTGFVRFTFIVRPSWPSVALFLRFVFSNPYWGSKDRDWCMLNRLKTNLWYMQIQLTHLSHLEAFSFFFVCIGCLRFYIFLIWFERLLIFSFPPLLQSDPVVT